MEVRRSIIDVHITWHKTCCFYDSLARIVRFAQHMTTTWYKNRWPPRWPRGKITVGASLIFTRLQFYLRKSHIRNLALAMMQHPWRRLLRNSRDVFMCTRTKIFSHAQPSWSFLLSAYFCRQWMFPLSPAIFLESARMIEYELELDLLIWKKRHRSNKSCTVEPTSHWSRMSLKTRSRLDHLIEKTNTKNW